MMKFKVLMEVLMYNPSYQQEMAIIKEHQQQLPADIIAIADALRIRVYNEKNWPNDLSGKILKDNHRGGESGYAIYINACHRETRQRFTLAHEIAHFILHKENIGDGIADDALY